MNDQPILEIALRVLLMLRELHQMGYERLRAASGMSASVSMNFTEETD